MIICFRLSMPNVGSCNGKWSGEGDLYAVTEHIKDKEKAAKILSKSSYYYRFGFGDGWGASVSVTEVSSKEEKSIRKRSKGFCGYDWMITRIINTGRIDVLRED